MRDIAEHKSCNVGKGYGYEARIVRRGNVVRLKREEARINDDASKPVPFDVTETGFVTVTENRCPMK